MRERRWFLPVAGMLTATAWLALCLWAWSPYGRYLDHGNWAQTGLGVALCGAFPAAGRLLPTLIYVGGWLLMTAAMMLPAVLPLLDRFDRLVASRADRHRLLALLIGGYLAVWLGFGVVAHALDSGLHAAAIRSDWLLLNGWAVGSLILAVAGLFQFSRLKYRCLARCRTPFSFIAKHWHGRRPLRDALLLGLDHGAFCVGCCWAIMLLMFVVGTGNIGWMLVLSVVMTVEKNLRWGRRLSAPLGAALLTAAAAVAVINLAA